jgi:hypothetical protein
MLPQIDAFGNENRLVIDYGGGQVTGLAALTRWNSLLGLHQEHFDPRPLPRPPLLVPHAGAGGAYFNVM